MSAVAAPRGLVPKFHPSGLIRSLRVDGGIETGYASAIYKGSPVILATTGFLTIGTTAADIFGIFAGVEYTDSEGRRRVANHWTANTAATEIVAWVWRDPAIVYEIQANGAVAQTALGDQSDFVNPGAGSTVTGLSTAALNSTLAGAGVQGQLRIVDLAPYADNAWGDAFTIVQVEIARHQFVANKVAI